ncbi:MAG: GNAT family N-acetyltransferase [Candidatus Methanofastidiosia archaeon]
MCPYLYEVELVPVEKKFLPFLDALWKDPLVTKYTGIPPEGISVNKWYQNFMKSKKKNRDSFEQFIVIDCERRPLGETAFAMLPDVFSFGDWNKDEERPCAMADIKLARDHWDKGIGTHAFLKLIEFVFSKTHASDLIGLPYIDNTRAKNMYSRCGLNFTGHKNPNGFLVYKIAREAW